MHQWSSFFSLYLLKVSQLFFTSSFFQLVLNSPLFVRKKKKQKRWKKKSKSKNLGERKKENLSAFVCLVNEKLTRKQEFAPCSSDKMRMRKRDYGRSAEAGKIFVYILNSNFLAVNLFWANFSIFFNFIFARLVFFYVENYINEWFCSENFFCCRLPTSPLLITLLSLSLL